MGFSIRSLRVPRLRTFFHFMTLRTGTELATLALVLNKVSGVYGMLALLTGLHLSPLQLSMYIYSIAALALVLYLAPHIRTQRPFECLALGTFYVFDSMINALWTIAFGITWFLVVSEHHNTLPAAGKTMSDAAGFTSPEHNVSSVDVLVGPDQGIPGKKHDAITAGSMTSSPSVGHGVLQPESVPSILIICILWALRIYLTLIVLSYVRQVLQRHIMISGKSNAVHQAGTKDQSRMESPFGEHSAEGQGPRGRIGRFLITIAKSYWLDVDQVDEAALNEAYVMGRMRKREGATLEAPGVIERERRRRSGTGPPPLATPVPPTGSQGQHLRVQEIREGK